MTTARGQISNGLPGQLDKQLKGAVWLCQNPSEWPITVCTSESQVVAWLKQNQYGVAWEYSVTPVRRVKVVNPDPYLAPDIQVHPAEEEIRA